jgi:hypothetical protein
MPISLAFWALHKSLGLENDDQGAIVSIEDYTRVTNIRLYRNGISIGVCGCLKFLKHLPSIVFRLYRLMQEVIGQGGKRKISINENSGNIGDYLLVELLLLLRLRNKVVSGIWISPCRWL